jgi:hypothetical protein
MSHKRLLSLIARNRDDDVAAYIREHPNLRESCASFGAIPKLAALTGYMARSSCPDLSLIS